MHYCARGAGIGSFAIGERAGSYGYILHIALARIGPNADPVEKTGSDARREVAQVKYQIAVCCFRLNLLLWSRTNIKSSCARHVVKRIWQMVANGDVTNATDCRIVDFNTVGDYIANLSVLLIYRLRDLKPVFLEDRYVEGQICQAINCHIFTNQRKPASDGKRLTVKRAFGYRHQPRVARAHVDFDKPRNEAIGFDVDKVLHWYRSRANLQRI